MGYCHMFYGLDLAQLQSVYGSGDQRLLEDILSAQAEELDESDAFFESDIENKTCPDSRTALREIFAGSFGKYERADPMFGYVLKILCIHLGKQIGEDVAAVRDHCYSSQLTASGPPIPIPYDKSDFPEIGFLSSADIPQEIARIDAAPKTVRRSLALTIISLLTHGAIGHQMSDEEAAEDMAAYRRTLEEALAEGISIVSFRH
jgi:hypothetical protein